MKNILTLIFIVLFVIILWVMLSKATDRICDKPFSAEFKQTEQYKELKCP